MSLRQTLVRGASSAFLVRVFAAGITFAVHALLGNLLGKEEYGRFVYFLTAVTVLVLVAKIGLDTAALRFVPRFIAAEDWARLRGFVRRSSALTLLASAALAGLAALAVALLQEIIGVDRALVGWIGCLLIPIYAVASVQNAVLQALRRVFIAEATQGMLRPVLLLVGVILGGAYLDPAPSAPLAMTCNVLAALAGLLVAAVLLRRSLPREVLAAEPSHATAEWLRVSFPLLLISASQLVLNHTDTLMIGPIISEGAAGVYFAAAKIATIVAFGLSAVNAIVAPMISDLYHKGDRVRLQRMVVASARVVVAFTAVATALVAVAGRWVLGFWGPDFVEGYVPLLILCGGQVVNALAGSVGFLLTMTGHQKVAARVIGGCAVLNVPLNATLIPTLGIVGAAIATALTTALWNIILVVQVRRRLGLRSTAIG